MKNAFGASFLWLIWLVYFTQGFKSFEWTAVSYMLKDELKCSPSISQFVSSVVFVRWIVKPLYGILSDCIPIKGRRRIPYVAISTVITLVPWIILVLNMSMRTSWTLLMMFLTLRNVGSAIVDALVGAMVAEAERFEGGRFAEDLQALRWFSTVYGGMFGRILGGFAVDNLETKTIFLVFAAFPALQLLSCTLVDEKRVSEVSHMKNETDDTSNGMDNASTCSSKARRRKKKTKRKLKKKLKLFYSFKTAAYSLFCAFKQPIILRPITWFFLSNITMPDLYAIKLYYQTESLKLGASFLGTTHAIGWIVLVIATYIYLQYLKNKNIKLRRILMWAQIGLSALILLDMLLVSRLNVSYGISDKIIVISRSALAYAINQFRFLPFLILSKKLCPPGTLLTICISINDLGGRLSLFLGAGLTSFLNLSSGSFDNLLLGTIIQFICIFIPVLFLNLIPEEATG